MHNYTPIKIILATAVFASLGAIYLFHQNGQSELKSLSLKPSHEILIRTSKLKPHFDIQLKNSEPNSENQEHLSLVAILETTKKIGSLRYKWILPENVTISGGQSLEGTLSDILPRTGKTWTTEFSNYSTENKKIHLRVWLPAGSDSMVSSAQYNTLFQNEIDQKHKDMIERQKEYFLEHPEKIRKFK